jgi:RNA polymerase sigma factor (sigma-70 family)
MDQEPDLKIILGILEHDNRVIQNVYNECYPMVERMIINSGGDHEQAKDVFQEAWIIIYRKLKEGELELSCKFSTYIYAICKKLWIQEKRKRITRMRQIPAEPEIVEEPYPYGPEDEDRIRVLFYKHFKQLSPDCQKILMLHFNEISIDEIQKIMSYQNSHYTMDRKYRCKKSLMQRIINDPNFKSIQNEYTEQIRSIS